MIEPDRYYRPSDPELRQIAAEQTLARWRHEGRGPAYTKSGTRVFYLGRDLLDFLKRGRVAPEKR